MSLLGSLILGIALLSLIKSIVSVVRMMRAEGWPPTRTVETSNDVPF